MLKKDQRVGVLFRMNDKDYVTLLNPRSRNRFKKLITDWSPLNGEIIYEPLENQTFQYLNVHVVLDAIENAYKDVKNAPAIERIIEQALDKIQTIRIQNSDDFDNDDDDND